MISIITPVFNSEKYIERCVESVAQQGIRNLEHIVMDGNSTDKTVEILKELSKKHPQLIWHSEPDCGQSDAMNKALKIAKGKFIGVLNADDYYEDQVLEEVIQSLEEITEPGLVVGQCYIKNPKGQIVYISKPKKLEYMQLLKGWYINPYPANPVQYFYHKTLHEKIGAYSIADMHTMDGDFILKAVQNAEVKLIDKVLGNFCLNKNCNSYKNTKNNNDFKHWLLLYEEHWKKLSPIKYYYFKSLFYLSAGISKVVGSMKKIISYN